MKRSYLIIAAFSALLLAGTASHSFAQETPTPDEKPNENRMNRPQRDFRIMEALGLTQDQIRQIRRINATRRPAMQEAQTRFREANAALDAAIYSETTDEELVKTRMKDVQLAQAEVIKERTLTEFLIRKVLTPDQLEKFRRLRERMRNRSGRQ